MAKKGTHLSEETKGKISLALKDKHNSKKTEFKKRDTPWNKGIKMWKNKDHTKGMLGKDSWNKNLKLTKEHKNKISLSHIGKKLSEEHKRKIALKNIGRKFSEETRRKIGIAHKGEKNWNWKGGISITKYDIKFNNIFKRNIRKRDNYICMKCGKHQEKEKRSLCIHHINYDKKLSIKENCITLCLKCNNEVNHNRKYWIKFFQSLLLDKYGYKYSENKEILLEVKNGCRL